MRWKVTAAELPLLFLVIFYLICCPFTKVEESFNMQAMYDLIHFGTQLQYYDHFEFPGVVPRTFLGSITVAALSIPFQILLHLLNLPPIYQQIACRAVLGVSCWASFVHFSSAIASKFSERAAHFTSLLCALQFHLCFYMSRPLPNIFALGLCLNAYAFWLNGRVDCSLILLTFTTVVFRCDVLVFLAPFTLQILMTRSLPFLTTCYIGILTGALSLSVTVLIDSWFWGRWLWPEGIVLFFNTIDNRSSEWGTMPVHWYFTNALPKSLNFTLIWAAVGMLGFRFPAKTLHLLSPPVATEDSVANQGQTVTLVDILSECFFARGINRQVLEYLLVPTMFITLYSFLPHKELRFVFPALPLFTLSAGVGIDEVLPKDTAQLLYPLNLLAKEQQFSKSAAGQERKLLKRFPAASPIHRYYRTYTIFSSIVVLALFVGKLILASTFLSASYHNYPGAVALDRLLQQHLPMHLADHHNLGVEQDVEYIETGTTEEYKRHSIKLLPLAVDFRPTFVHIDASAAMTGVTRFLQRRFIWGVTNRDSTCTKHSRYLNMDPADYDHNINVCLQPESSSQFFSKGVQNIDCAQEEDLDVLFYSKEERVTDYGKYDWIVTADPSEALETGAFHIADEIKGYHGVRLTWFGPQVQLKTAMYILVNTAVE